MSIKTNDLIVLKNYEKDTYEVHEVIAKLECKESADNGLEVGSNMYVVKENNITKLIYIRECDIYGKVQLTVRENLCQK